MNYDILFGNHIHDDIKRKENLGRGKKQKSGEPNLIDKVGYKKLKHSSRGCEPRFSFLDSFVYVYTGMYHSQPQMRTHSSRPIPGRNISRKSCQSTRSM